MCRRVLPRLNRLPSVGYDQVRCVGAIPGLRNHFDRHTGEAHTNRDVAGNGSVSGTTPSDAVDPTVPVPGEISSSPASSRDELKNSSAAKMTDRNTPPPESRAERLARIKAAIENGDYDTDEKLEAALSKMFDSLGIDLGDE